MEQIVLEAKERATTGKGTKKLRREGWVPAVIYGNQIDPRSIMIKAKPAEAAVSEAGTSQLISVQIDEKKPVQALVRDLQRDPIRRNLLHIDFYEVDMAQKITAEIPLSFVGESPVTTQNLGIVVQERTSIEVECLPGDLVDAFEVDLSDLIEVDQQITVRDLAIPAEITVLTDPDETILRASYLEEIPEEEEELEFEDLIEGEPEVIARGKEEEGSEEESED